MQNVEKTVDTLQNVEYSVVNLQTVGRRRAYMGLSLKQWRLAKEISQTEMATKCGVHRNTYAAWEENPDEISIGNAKIIARVLRESVDTIFFNGDSTKCSFKENELGTAPTNKEKTEEQGA